MLFASHSYHSTYAPCCRHESYLMREHFAYSCQHKVFRHTLCNKHDEMIEPERDVQKNSAPLDYLCPECATLVNTYHQTTIWNPETTYTGRRKPSPGSTNAVSRESSREHITHSCHHVIRDILCAKNDGVEDDCHLKTTSISLDRLYQVCKTQKTQTKMERRG